MTLVQPDPSDHILMHICIIEPLLTFFNNSTFGRGAVGQSCQTTLWWGSVVISCSREMLFSKFLLWLWSMTSDQFHSFYAQYAIHMYATDLTAIIWPQFCQRRRQIVLLAILLLIIQISSSSQCWPPTPHCSQQCWLSTRPPPSPFRAPYLPAIVIL